MAVNIGINVQRSPNRINQALREAGVNGQYPKLLFNFEDNYYLTNGSSKSLNDAFTFTRNGNATMVDSDGLIKWAPHNLLTYSEQFDNAAWVKTNATVENNVIVAPDGATTADKIIASATSSVEHSTQQTIAIVSNQETFSVYVKAGEYDYVMLRTNIGGSWDAGGVIFNLASGTVGSTGTGIDFAQIQSVGEGWYLCSITYDDRQRNLVQIHPMPSDGGVVGSEILYTGDGASGIYIWGAHLYRSDLGGMVNNPDRGDSYVPTTSLAVYLPRRGHHKYNGDQWVNKGILVESEPRTNLWLYSNDPTQSAWSFSNEVTRPTSASTTGLDGETSGYALIPTTALSSHYVAQQFSLTSGNSYTFSFYLKQNGYRYIQIVVGGAYSADDYANFDLQDGVVGNTSATATATIKDEGNGWFRCSCTFPADATATGSSGIGFIQSLTDGRVPTFAADGVSGVYVHQAQLELGSTPSSLIPTNGSSVTRAAETVTVPYANLPWPEPTYIGDELVTNGTFDTDSDWTLGTGWSISGGVATAVSSSVNINQNISNQQGKILLIEFDVIMTGGTYLRAEIGSTFGANITSSGRYSTILIPSTTSGLLYIYGNNFSGSIDNISVREINPLSVSIAMAGEINYADEGGYDVKIFSWQKDLDNRIVADIYNAGALTGQVQFTQEIAGVADQSIGAGSDYAPDINVPFNIASRNGSTFINGAVDGVALTANTTPTALPDLSATNLTIATDYMGTVSEFRIWDRDIGDTGIAEATKPSTEPSLSLTFDGQPSSFTNGGLTV
jgi:hypothetical protein